MWGDNTISSASHIARATNITPTLSKHFEVTWMCRPQLRHTVHFQVHKLWHSSKHVTCAIQLLCTPVSLVTSVPSSSDCTRARLDTTLRCRRLRNLFAFTRYPTHWDSALRSTSNMPGHTPTALTWIWCDTFWHDIVFIRGVHSSKAVYEYILFQNSSATIWPLSPF